MWTRGTIEKLSETTGVSIHIWGRTGEEAVLEVEQKLGCRLSDEIRRFGTDIGNVSIGPREIVITGNRIPEGETSCALRTAQVRYFADGAADNLIVIGELYDTLYCWSIDSGAVLEYLELERFEPLVAREWSSFESFLDEIIPEAIKQTQEAIIRQQQETSEQFRDA